MDDFTVTSKLTQNEYAKVVFWGLLRKPAFILVQLCGIYLLIYDDSYILGTFFILLPGVATLIAVLQFKSSASSNDVTYTFGENGIGVEAPTCKSEYTWKHIVKYRQINDFLILYHNSKVGNFIDVRMLSTEQLQFIKDKLDKR